MPYSMVQQPLLLLLPDYADPRNSVAQAYQNAGCQVVAMMIWKNDSYLKSHDEFFTQQFKTSFVLKPEKYRYLPEMIDAPKAQDPANSYATRTLDTGVAGIKFDI